MPKKQRFKTRVTQHRRRREGRTNYSQRLDLLKSGNPRLVIRRSANNVVCQLIKHDTKGDKTLLTVTAQDLKKAGWKGHCGNTPAAYLIGLICGTEARGRKIHEAVLDVGLHSSTKGSRIYAALKGASDGGLKVPHSEDIVPDKARLSGKHIGDYAAKLKAGKPQAYKRQFSLHVKAKLDPEELSKHFEEIKKKILKQ